MTKNSLLAMVEGAGAVVSGFLSASYLLNSSTIFQQQLARASELTQETINSARIATDALTRGDLYLGLIGAGVSGILATSAIYRATRPDRE